MLHVITFTLISWKYPTYGCLSNNYSESHLGLTDQVVLVLRLFASFLLVYYSFFRINFNVKPFLFYLSHSAYLRGHNIHHLGYCSLNRIVVVFFIIITLKETI